MRKEATRVHSFIHNHADDVKAIQTIYFAMASTIVNNLKTFQEELPGSQINKLNCLTIANKYADTLADQVVLDGPKFRSILHSFVKAKYLGVNPTDVTTPLSLVGWNFGDIDTSLDVGIFASDLKILLFGI